MVNIKCSNNPNLLESKLNKINKIHVFDKNLHEIKQEILVYYAGECELVIKSEKFTLDLGILLITKLIINLLMEDMMQKMLFSKVIFKN